MNRAVAAVIFLAVILTMGCTQRVINSAALLAQPRGSIDQPGTGDDGGGGTITPPPVISPGDPPRGPLTLIGLFDSISNERITAVDDVYRVPVRTDIDSGAIKIRLNYCPPSPVLNLRFNFPGEGTEEIAATCADGVILLQPQTFTMQRAFGLSLAYRESSDNTQTLQTFALASSMLYLWDIRLGFINIANDLWAVRSSNRLYSRPRVAFTLNDHWLANINQFRFRILYFAGCEEGVYTHSPSNYIFSTHPLGEEVVLESTLEENALNGSSAIKVATNCIKLEITLASTSYLVYSAMFEVSLWGQLEPHGRMTVSLATGSSLSLTGNPIEVEHEVEATNTLQTFTGEGRNIKDGDHTSDISFRFSTSFMIRETE